MAGEPKCFERTEGEVPTQVFERQSVQLSESEILTRLIFAEGISTGFSHQTECRELGPEIFKSIGYGVRARVEMGQNSSSAKKRFGDSYQSVIFKKGQFNPAVSSRSKYSEYFLCPQKHNSWPTYWNWATLAAEEVIDGKVMSPLLINDFEKSTGLSLVSHFYYPSSSQATPSGPSWRDNSKRIENLLVDGKQIPHTCIEFFRLERELNYRSVQRKKSIDSTGISD